MANLHDREETVDLIKAALNPDNGKRMFNKGDLPGHEFRGNQHTSGMSSAEASLSTDNANNTTNHAQMVSKNGTRDQAIEAHLQAAVANREASKAHGKMMIATAGKDEELYQYHQTMANEHTRVANEHESHHMDLLRVKHEK